MPHPRAPHSEDDGYETRGSSAFSRFLSGLAAFSAGVFICGACSSYSAADASFNMAVARVRDAATGLVTEAAPENMFGMVGAGFGDMLMQGFGWTAILLGFGLMIGGVRRAFGIGQQDPAGWMWGLAAILFAACCLAEWPIPKSWDMSAGLGGVVGEVMLAVTATPFAALQIPEPQVWASAIAGLCAILFAAMAMGMGASDATSLWRALTKKPEYEPQHQPAMAGVPALASRPVASNGLVHGVMRLIGIKPKEVIEPIVYTEEDGFEDGERGFFSAVENSETANRQRPIVPRVLEGRPVPDAQPAPAAVAAPAAPRTISRPSQPQPAAAAPAPQAAPAPRQQPGDTRARCLARHPADRTARRSARRAARTSTKPACSTWPIASPACSTSSASRAASPKSAPARSSRCSSLNPLPACVPRKSSRWPKTSRAPCRRPPRASPSSRAATPSASNCRTRTARPSISATS